jgi:hypothetical protein
MTPEERKRIKADMKAASYEKEAEKQRPTFAALKQGCKTGCS